jgi:hypothetical protein
MLTPSAHGGNATVREEEQFRAAVRNLSADDLEVLQELSRPLRRELLRNVARMVGARTAPSAGQLLEELPGLTIDQWREPIAGRQSLADLVIKPVISAYRARMGDEASDPSFGLMETTTGVLLGDVGEGLVRLTLAWVILLEFNAAPHAQLLLEDPELFPSLAGEPIEEDDADSEVQPLQLVVPEAGVADSESELAPVLDGSGGNATSTVIIEAVEEDLGSSWQVESRAGAAPAIESDRLAEVHAAWAEACATQVALKVSLDAGQPVSPDAVRRLEAFGQRLDGLNNLLTAEGFPATELTLDAVTEAHDALVEARLRNEADAAAAAELELEQAEELSRLRHLLDLHSDDPVSAEQIEALAELVEMASSDAEQNADLRRSLLSLERFASLSAGGAPAHALLEASRELVGLPATLADLKSAISFGVAYLSPLTDVGAETPSQVERGEAKGPSDASSLQRDRTGDQSSSDHGIESAAQGKGGEDGAPEAAQTAKQMADLNAEATQDDSDDADQSNARASLSGETHVDGPSDGSPVAESAPSSAGEEPVVHPQAAAVEAPQGSVVAPHSPDDADALFARLIAEDRLALARWFALAGEAPHPAAACLEALLLARHLDPGASDVAAAFSSATSSIDSEHLAGSEGLQILALLACATAGFRSPLAIDFGLLGSLERHLNDFEEVGALARVLGTVAEMGVVPGDALADAAQRQADLDEQAQEFAALARDILEKGPHRRILYAPATETWRELVNPDGPHGRIASLLAPVAADDRSQAKWISEDARLLGDASEVERLIDSTRVELGHRKVIEARARNRIGLYIEEAVGVAQAWSAYALRAKILGNTAGAGDIRKTQVLRDQLGDLAPRMQKLTQRWVRDRDPLVQVAGAQAASTLEDIRTLLAGGVFERPDAIDVAALLNRDLMLIPSLPMSGLAPRRNPTLDELHTAIEAPLGWREAFDRRLEAHNLSACRALLRVIEVEDPDLAAQVMPTLDAHGAQFKSELDHRVADLESSLGLAIADGVIDDSTASRLQAALVEIDVAAEVPDQDQVLDIIEEVGADLDAYRNSGRSERRERLTALIAERPQLQDSAERVEEVIEHGSLGVADDFLSLLERGDALPRGGDESSLFDRFFPATLMEVEEDTDLASVASGTRSLPSLDLSGLGEDRIQQASSAWQAWESISTASPLDADLTRIVRELGFTQPEIRRVRNRPAPDRWWFDLDARPQGRVMVPEFGSAANGHYRLLVVQDQPTAQRLQGYIKADESAAPLIVLFRGSMSGEHRRAFAEIVRRSSDRRSVALVDDAAYLVALRYGDRLCTTVMNCTLPFTAINPYTPFVAGQVPDEMFYGRDEERRQLLDPNGPAFVYGGRQLGKSALLREITRRAKRQGDTALYLDLAYEGIGSFRQADELWLLLSQRLADVSVGTATKVRTGDAFDSVRGQIERWLEENRRETLYVLLDECDNLLDDDVRRKFVVTQRIRGLVDSNRGRLKFVLAGLHVVQRFERIPNQPLAHVASGKVVIGPLAPSDSADLIREPLGALGYRFADPHLVYRIAAYTNNQASILQLVADRLTRRMLDRARPVDSPPYLVTEREVNDTFADARLHEDIRQRFEWTIDLDRRYRVVALVTAAHAYEAGASDPMDASDLRQECLRAWPAGFQNESHESFNAVLKEMEGLGVIRRITASGWGLRTPGLLRLLGSHYDILESIEGLTDFALEDNRFDAVKAHRSMEGMALPSPLNEEQVRRILETRGSFLAVGSKATGIADVASALRMLADSEGMAWTHTVVADGRLREGLRRVTSGSTAAVRLVVIDLQGLPAAGALSSYIQASELLVGESSVTAVFLCDAPSAELIGQFSVERLIVLRRWDRSTIDFWLRDADLNLTTTLIDDLAAASGGWRCVLAAWDTRVRSGATPAEALDGMRAWMDTEAGARTLWESAGLAGSSDAMAGWEALIAWDKLGPEDWAEGLNSIERHESSGGAAEAVLRGLGAIVELSDAENQVAYAAEPVLRAAYQSVGGGAPSDGA